MGAEPSRIRLNKINGFIKGHDGTRYLALFGGEKYDFIYNRIRYLIGMKSGITNAISHYYVKIKVDSYNSLPLEKTSTFHNVMILFKSVFSKDKNNLYYTIILDKGSNELTEITIINKFLYKL